MGTAAVQSRGLFIMHDMLQSQTPRKNRLYWASHFCVSFSAIEPGGHAQRIAAHFDVCLFQLSPAA